MQRHLLLVLVLGLAAGCASGDVNADLVDCGPNGECPAGFTCDGKTNKCVVQGSTHGDAGTPVTLTLGVTGDGTIMVSGQSTCSSASRSYTVAAGDRLTLTATPS